MKAPTAPRDLLLLGLAMTLPTVAAWLYFVRLDGSGHALVAYGVAKGVQCLLPLLWFFRHRGEQPAWTGPLTSPRRAIIHGLISGAVLSLGIGLAAAFGLLGSPLEGSTASRVTAKVDDLGLGSPARYAAMAAALSVIHSLFEEVYWRWFVFGGLKNRLPQGLALTLASLSFGAHHWIVVGQYAPGGMGDPLAILAVLGIVGAGAHWCLLYRSSGGLLAPWISHLLVDVAVMSLGAALIW